MGEGKKARSPNSALPKPRRPRRYLGTHALMLKVMLPYSLPAFAPLPVPLPYAVPYVPASPRTLRLQSTCLQYITRSSARDGGWGMGMRTQIPPDQTKGCEGEGGRTGPGRLERACLGGSGTERERLPDWVVLSARACTVVDTPRSVPVCLPTGREWVNCARVAGGCAASNEGVEVQIMGASRRGPRRLSPSTRRAIKVLSRCITIHLTSVRVVWTWVGVSWAWRMFLLRPPFFLFLSLSSDSYSDPDIAPSSCLALTRPHPLSFA